MKVTSKEIFPQNLLDAIAKDCRKPGWECPLPRDFELTLAYVLASLPERSAQCIMSYYRDGKTYEEIGEVFGVTKSRVGTIVRQAIHRLAHTSRRIYLEIGVQGMIKEEAQIAQHLGVKEIADKATESRMKVTGKEAISQLRDLKHDRESFLSGDDTGIFEADIAAIETAIHALEKTNWIPCSEKLPDDGQAVIGCEKGGFITRYRFEADDPPCWIDDHEEFFSMEEIVAWMPLPEPYDRNGTE